MTEPRRPRYTKRDANQREIVNDLRRLGFCVLDLADVGGYVPDLFVCGQTSSGEWHWLAVEVKKFKGRFTAKQKAFSAEWPNVPSTVAWTTEDILRWYGR